MSEPNEQLEHDYYPFFAVTTTKLAIMSLLTFGIYPLYWFYKTWKAVKIHEDPAVMPFWRVVFLVFFVKETFDKIQETATDRGLNLKTFSMVSTVFVFITFYLSNFFPTPYFFVSLLGFIGLIPANSVAGKLNTTLVEDEPIDGRIKGWNWLAVLLGPSFAILLLLLTAPGAEEQSTAELLWLKGNYEGAQTHYEKALKASEKSDFLNMHDYEVRYSYGAMLLSYANSLPESEATKKSTLLAEAREHTTWAVDYLGDGIEIFTTKGEASFSLGEIYVAEAILAKYQEDYYEALQKAFVSYQAAATEFEHTEDWISLSASYYKLASVSHSYDDLTEAIRWIEKAIVIDEENNLQEDLKLDTQYLEQLKTALDEQLVAENGADK